VNRVNKPKVTVAVDGSLYRFHPHFHKLMMKMTSTLIKPGVDVSIVDNCFHFPCYLLLLGKLHFVIPVHLNTDCNWIVTMNIDISDVFHY